MENPVVFSGVQKLMDSFHDRYDNVSLKLRDTVYREVYKEYGTESRAMQYARAFARFLAEKPVVVYPYDIIAGQLQHHNLSTSLPFGWSDSVHKQVSGDTYSSVKKMMLQCMPLFTEPLSVEDRDALELLETGAKNGFFMHTNNGHVISGFENVLRFGYGGLLEKVREKKNDPSLSLEQKDYLEAMRIALEAARHYIRRYAQAARDTQSPNLNRIAQGCENIAEKPASGFFEAIQSILLLQELVSMESRSGSLSFGRVDQMLYPYYKKDREEGRISEDEALALIDAWRVKIAGMMSGYQNVAIGGCDAAGKFAGNDITRLIMKSTARLRYDQPLLSLRYTKDMPDDYWEEALKLIELGDGFPALFNDDVIIRALRKAGVAEEDAWNYGLVGCVEPSIGGKEFSNTEQLRINWAMVLELMMTGGVCRITGDRIALQNPRPLESIRSYEEFLAWYRDELEYFIKKAAHACILMDTVYHKAYPAVLLSSTVEGCIENSSDACAFGPVYRFSNINNTGMANIVDSLMVIKETVFEKKMMSLSGLNETLAGDFADNEELINFIRMSCGKFGNGEEEPERLMEELVHLAADAINAISNGRGFRFRSGFYSVEWHAGMGAKTGATPDGRKAGTSLANGFCPVQGADTKGPTAVINAVTRCDHTKFANGMVLDLKFNPSFLKNPVHRNLFRPLADTYFEQGGMELQFNIVSRETLIAAQKDPHKYRNLIVRVSGFSAYFASLYKPLQDEIIARTEYTETAGA